jgi:hypothetical protein
MAGSPWAPWNSNVPAGMIRPSCSTERPHQKQSTRVMIPLWRAASSRLAGEFSGAGKFGRVRAS